MKDNLLKALVLLALAIAGVGVFVAWPRGAGLPGGPVGIVLDGRDLVSPPLGFRLTVPEPWLLEPSETGEGVVASLPDGSVVFVASAVARAEDEVITPDDVFDDVMRTHMQRSGAIFEVVRRNAMLGDVDARELDFQIEQADAEARVRLRLAMLPRATVSTWCTSTVGDAEGGASCDALLARLELPR